MLPRSSQWPFDRHRAEVARVELVRVRAQRRRARLRGCRRGRSRSRRSGIPRACRPSESDAVLRASAPRGTRCRCRARRSRLSGVELHPIQALAAAESASTPTRREIVRTVIIPSWKGQIRKKCRAPGIAPKSGDRGCVVGTPLRRAYNGEFRSPRQDVSRVLLAAPRTRGSNRRLVRTRSPDARRAIGSNRPHLAINPRRGRADAAAMLRDPRRREPRPYQSIVLEEPRLGAAGVEHGPQSFRELVRWRDVRGAVAAEVGEPEGVRTIVFDLLARTSAGRIALRLDAEPGEPAAALARAIAAAIGERARPSIKSLAVDGTPTLWFPDLAEFEEAARRESSASARVGSIPSPDAASRRRPDPVRGLLLPLPRDLPGGGAPLPALRGPAVRARRARGRGPPTRRARVRGCRSRPARRRRRARADGAALRRARDLGARGALRGALNLCQRGLA